MLDVRQIIVSNPFLIALATLAVGIFLHFIYQYLIRGFQVRRNLIDVERRIKRFGKKPPPSEQLREALGAAFKGSRLFNTWEEYEKTLHDQYTIQSGQRVIDRVRSTLPAEAILNLESVVDPWIGSEYFKHVPGILTGLGIIGTFTGLIQGLVHFDPNAVDSTAVRQGLGDLFGHVREAFTFSGVAIGLAMLVTIVEKWLYASCSKHINALTQTLDALFRAGVGEEYLSDLLRTSRDGATQVRQLKEAMVDDLKTLLTELTQRQIDASRTATIELGARIESGLKQPLSELSQIVAETAGRHTTAASTALEQLMTSFLAQMRESMGGQLGDLSHLLQQTTQSMAQVELSVRALVTDLQSAGQSSTSAMHDAVQQLLSKLEAHHMERDRATSGSTERVIQHLQTTIDQIAARDAERSRRDTEHSRLIDEQNRNAVTAIAGAAQESVESTNRTIEKITGASDAMAQKLAGGFDSLQAATTRLAGAASQLAQLSSNVTTLLQDSKSSAAQLKEVGGQLAVASLGLGTAVTQFGVTSSRLETVSKAMTTEADARGRLLEDLRTVITRSTEAAAEFRALSDAVKESLVSGIDTFGGAVSKVLSEHLRDYDKQLGDAVSMLTVAMEALAEQANDQVT